MAGPIDQGELIYRVRVEGDGEAAAKLERMVNAGTGSRGFGGASSGAGGAASFGGGANFYSSGGMVPSGISNAGSAASFGGAAPNIPSLPSVEVAPGLAPAFSSLAGAVSNSMAQYDRSQTAISNQVSQAVQTQAGSIQRISSVVTSLTGQNSPIVQFTKALETDRKERSALTSRAVSDAARIANSVDERASRRDTQRGRRFERATQQLTNLVDFPMVGAFADEQMLAATGTEGPGRFYSRAGSGGGGRRFVSGAGSASGGGGSGRGRRFRPASPPPPPPGGGGGGDDGDDERPVDNFKVIDMDSRRRSREATFARREERNSRSLELQEATAQRLEAQIIRADVQLFNAETAQVDAQVRRSNSLLRERLQPTLERARENRARSSAISSETSLHRRLRGVDVEQRLRAEEDIRQANRPSTERALEQRLEASALRAETSISAANRNADAERRRRKEEDLRQELLPEREGTQRRRSRSSLISSGTQLEAAMRRNREERVRQENIEQDIETRRLRSRASNLQQHRRLNREEELIQEAPVRRRRRALRDAVRGVIDSIISPGDVLDEARQRASARLDRIRSHPERQQEALERETQRELNRAERSRRLGVRSRIDALASLVAPPLSEEEVASQQVARVLRQRGLTPDQINQQLSSQGLPPVPRGGGGGTTPWGQRPWGGVGGKLDLAANVGGWGLLLASGLGAWWLQGQQQGFSLGPIQTPGIQGNRIEQDYIRTLAEMGRAEQERQYGEAQQLLELDRSRRGIHREYALQSGMSSEQHFRQLGQFTMQEHDTVRGLSGVVTGFNRSMEDFVNSINQIQTNFTRVQERFGDARFDIGVREERFTTAMGLRSRYREEDHQRALDVLGTTRDRAQQDFNRQFERFYEGRRRFDEQEEWRISDYNRDLGRIQRSNRWRQDDETRAQADRDRRIRERREDDPLERTSAVFGLIGALESGDVGTMIGGILSWRRFQREREEFEENAARGGLTEQQVIDKQRAGVLGQEAEDDFREGGRRAGIQAGYTREDMQKQEAEMIENIKRFNQDLVRSYQELDIKLIRDRNTQAMEEMYHAQDVLTEKSRISRAEVQAAADLIVQVNQLTTGMTRNITDTQLALQNGVISLQRLETERQRQISDFENMMTTHRQNVNRELDKIVGKETEIYIQRSKAQEQHATDMQNALMMYERQKQDLALAREMANFQLLMGLGFAALFAPWAELAAAAGSFGGLPGRGGAPGGTPGSPTGAPGSPPRSPTTIRTALGTASQNSPRIGFGGAAGAGIFFTPQMVDDISQQGAIMPLAVFGDFEVPYRPPSDELLARYLNFYKNYPDIKAALDRDSDLMQAVRSAQGNEAKWAAVSDYMALRGYALGGVITRPTILSDMGGRPYGIMAEKGPEAIVPMNGKSLSPTFVFNFNGVGIGDRASIIQEAVDAAVRAFDLEMEQASITVFEGAA